jgi:methylene-tetrahydromethanopterin dehydrogenase
MGGNIKIPLVIDPRGAATTAASLVGKMKKNFLEKGQTLKNLKISILGGTGPVGRIAGALCNSEGADTYIVETWSERNQTWLDSFIAKFNKEYNVALKGVLLTDEKSRVEHCMDKDLIISCGAAGIELLGKNSMELLSQNAPGKYCVDINLVPPPGIYGIKPDSDGQEIFPGMYGYGPLNIGQIKFQTELAILEEARKVTCGIFDFKQAYESAKKILKIK